ncbi:hypothetical protein GPECTOR_4g773 [Gonium pectorale]|uniref:Uncharacterized protein n=1 Tax=Gonium pectorale TaxID=33097 RepID=A0A150GY11_GONPE|nr:hypothetical protein GPECTOR_4g773 [Gonium pectorale]|eukprot:KXZ54705.1 hypothetical protein GPECTOR_4g773 [Gonium pectorale]
MSDAHVIPREAEAVIAFGTKGAAGTMDTIAAATAALDGPIPFSDGGCPLGGGPRGALTSGSLLVHLAARLAAAAPPPTEGAFYFMRASVTGGGDSGGGVMGSRGILSPPGQYMLARTMSKLLAAVAAACDAADPWAAVAGRLRAHTAAHSREAARNQLHNIDRAAIGGGDLTAELPDATQREQERRDRASATAAVGKRGQRGRESDTSAGGRVDQQMGGSVVNVDRAYGWHNEEIVIEALRWLPEAADATVRGSHGGSRGGGGDRGADGGITVDFAVTGGLPPLALGAQVLQWLPARTELARALMAAADGGKDRRVIAVGDTSMLRLLVLVAAISHLRQRPPPPPSAAAAAAVPGAVQLRLVALDGLQDVRLVTTALEGFKHVLGSDEAASAGCKTPPDFTRTDARRIRCQVAIEQVELRTVMPAEGRDFLVLPLLWHGAAQKLPVMEHAVARAYVGMMRQRRKGRRGGKGRAYVGKAEACGPVGGESEEGEEGGGKGEARALQPTGIASAVAIAGSGDGGSDGGDGEENDGGDDGCAFDPYGLECG